MASELANQTDYFSYLINPLDVLNKIELRFDEKRVIPWMSAHWTWSFVYSALYLVLVFGGQRIMKNREVFGLRRELCMWSTGLSVFSFYALFRIVPLAYRLVTLGGLQYAVCDSRLYAGSTVGGLWAFLFPLSKLFELVDTVFILLRKRNVIFLHWYHHLSVLIFCWYSYAYPISCGTWFGMVNYFVHSIMYAYYAVRASGRSPPKWVAKCITTIQLSQFFFGIFLICIATKALLENKQCGMTFFKVGISLFFYVSYAILFGNYYYWTYIYKGPKKAGQGSKVSEQIPRTTPNRQIFNGLGHVTNGTSDAKATVAK